MNKCAILKLKNLNFLNVKKSVELESTMLAVYTLSSKKRNVLVDPNKYEYNLLEKLVTGEVSVGEISGWGNCGWGSCD